MTYKQVIEDWNGKIGLPSERPRQPGLGAQPVHGSRHPQGADVASKLWRRAGGQRR